MKKIITFGIVLALVLSFGSVSSFAASPIETVDGSDSANVYGTFVAGGASQVIYSVDVSWGAMEFTYTSASEGAWNPETRTFSNVTPAKWTVNETDGDKITVTNSSNAAVDVEFSFANDAATPNVTGAFSIGSSAVAGNSFTLASAVGTAGSAAPTNFAKFVPGGSIDAGNGVKIGTITVKLG